MFLEQDGRPRQEIPRSLWDSSFTNKMKGKDSHPRLFSDIYVFAMVLTLTHMHTNEHVYNHPHAHHAIHTHECVLTNSHSCHANVLTCTHTETTRASWPMPSSAVIRRHSQVDP